MNFLFAAGSLFACAVLIPGRAEAQASAAIPPGVIELCRAAERGDTDEIRRQLAAGTSIHGRNEKGFSPITKAAANGRDNAVMLLLESGADPNSRVRNESGRSALALAAALGDLRVVTVLLDAGARVNMRGHDGSTALGRAAHGGHEEVVSLLLERGAAPNGWGKYIEDAGRTCTPLFLAAAAGHPKVVNMLLEAGAPADQSLTNGDSMFALAASGADGETLRMLLDGGADISGRLCNRGPTALQVAIYNGNYQAVKFLFDNGIAGHFGEDGAALAMREAQNTRDRGMIHLIKRMLQKHAQ